MLDQGTLAWLEIRLGRPLPDLPDRPQRGPRRDAGDMLALSAPPDARDMSGLVAQILYVDALDQVSERRIRCVKAWAARSGPVMTAFCLLRLEPRMFRVDRIREMIDLTTGEILPVDDFFGDLQDRSAGSIYFDSIRSGLRVLMALAASDGKVHEDEIEAVARWADRLADLHGIALTDALLARILRTARSMRPDVDAAVSGLRAALRSPAEAALLARAMRDLAHSDDVFAIQEQRLIETLVAAAKIAL